MTKQVKQVIVIRTDLKNTKGDKVRTGKLIAQACHASVGFLTQRLKDQGKGAIFSEVEWEWISGIYTKVCVKINNEEELVKIHLNANLHGIYSHLIIDKGLTEFGGIPTMTCCGIGPDYSDKIDEITGHLDLY